MEGDTLEKDLFVSHFMRIQLTYFLRSVLTFSEFSRIIGASAPQRILAILKPPAVYFFKTMWAGSEVIVSPLDYSSVVQ